MARSLAERYLVAATAFVAAAAWLGVGLENGLACLVVFVLALQAVRAYQRRSNVRSRGAPSRRERRSRDESSLEEMATARPAASGRGRTRPSGRVYDGDREPSALPVASEPNW